MDIVLHIRCDGLRVVEIGDFELIKLHKRTINIDYLFIKKMKKTKKNENTNYDPYENQLRLDSLDPYEGLIRSNIFIKRKKKHVD